MKRLWVILTLLIIFSCEDKKDTTPPEVQILSPINDSVVYEEVEIKCTSTDNDEVRILTLWINGEEKSISDTTEPYLMTWNTVYYDNGEYILSVRAEDNSGNKTDSDPVRVIVDNSLSIPKPIDVETVTYDIEKLTITWTPYTGNDFNRYEVLRSNSKEGQKQIVSTINQQSNSIFEQTDFNPNIENWFFIKIVDKYEFSSIGKGKTNIVNKPPEKSELFVPIYHDNNLEIVWEKNNDWDFKSYNLYDFNSNDLIFSGGSSDDTTFVVHNFPMDTKSKYKLEVQDHWDLVSNPFEIVGSSFQKIIYTEQIYGSRKGQNEIKVMDIDGNEKHLITENKYNKRFLCFSPDGLYISYDQYSDPGTSDIYDIYLSKWNGSDLINLTNNNNRFVYNILPEFSPNGDKVFYRSYSTPSDENFTNIMSVNIDGSNLESLTPSGSFDYIEFITENYIYFYSGGSFNQLDGLYRMDLNGAGRELILSNENDELSFWSGIFPLNNSSDFYYTTYDRDKRLTTLYKYLESGSSQIIIEVNRTITNPVISEDGNYVYFYNDHDDLTKRGIYSINLNTNDVSFLREGGTISSYHKGLFLITEWVSESNYDVFIYDSITGYSKNLSNSTYDNQFAKIQPRN